jgi:hypothetical protein
MRYLPVKEVADLLSINHQTVRKRFPAHKIGRAVRIWEGDLPKAACARALDVIDRDPGLSAVFKDYSGALAVLEYLDPDPEACADPEMAALLLSSIAACRLEHPNWELIGVDAVFAPVLAMLKASPPQGGGAKGDALRKVLEAA